MKIASKYIITFLSVGLSGFLVIPLTDLLSKIPWEEGWLWLAEPRMSWLAVILAMVGMFVLYFCLTGLYSFYFGKQKRMEKKLQKFNHSMWSDSVKVTWNVGMGSMFNDDPMPYNIKFFCLNHGPTPILMDQYGQCPFSDCPNRQSTVSEQKVRPLIESELLKRWEDLKKN